MAHQCAVRLFLNGTCDVLAERRFQRERRPESARLEFFQWFHEEVWECYHKYRPQQLEHANSVPTPVASHAPVLLELNGEDVLSAVHTAAIEHVVTQLSRLAVLIHSTSSSLPSASSSSPSSSPRSSSSSSSAASDAVTPVVSAPPLIHPLNVCPRDPDFPCTKVQQQVYAAVAERDATSAAAHLELWVLVLSGSFNPVHCMHTATFEMVRHKLLQRSTAAVLKRLVGGFLAPSSDAYVCKKLGSDAMPLKHRNALCELASSPFSYMDVLPWGIARASKVVEETTQRLRHLSDTLVPPHTSAASLTWVCREICGADHACKYSLWNDDQMRVCLCRPGYSGTCVCVGSCPSDLVSRHPMKPSVVLSVCLCVGAATFMDLASDTLLQRMRHDGVLTAADVASFADTGFVETATGFIVISDPSTEGNISSTSIRKARQARHVPTALKDLVDAGELDPNVATYLCTRMWSVESHSDERGP